MKKCIHSIFFLLVLSLLVSCESAEEKKRKMEVQLMSTQTLGLAYLEEMKLQEAETEFKKFIELSPDDKLGYANLGLVYLRMGQYEKAEERLSEAKAMDTADPDVNLLLATAYRLQGRNKEAIEVLEETLEKNPEHPKVLFELSELYAAEQDSEAQMKRQAYLERLTQATPGNLVPMILLVESYIKQEDADSALSELEKLPAQFPEFPAESMPYFNQVLESLQAGKTDEALIPFTVFHNYQKVTYPYQDGMTNLKGPGESALGFPLINYSESSAMSGDTSGDILESIRFSEVAASAGLRFGPVEDTGDIGLFPVHHVVGDYDGDGDMDIYIARKEEANGEFKSYLFQNELGRYQDFAGNYGLKHQGEENSAAFADFDNDGFLDLMIVVKNGAVMYHNAGKGNFVNITDQAGLSAHKGGSGSLFADLDHDGDLDLFQASDGQNQVFLNTGDRSFKEIENQMGLGGSLDDKTSEAVFGDFDDDGDLDLFLVNSNAPNQFAWNQRQGSFETVGLSADLNVSEGSKAAVAGDFNNDGLLDLALLNDSDRPLLLLENQGKGGFKVRSDLESDFKDLLGSELHDLEFIDFDNDGYLDLVLAGAAQS
ncbi:MAG: FG-GAP-like repeat-containing protein, partial [Lutimonas sp.]